MFKSSRPRVPSKAALRILYQLAYISSGTAVGVATLCAEERRRRTQFVQKIADNARRIRQSPRHVHNAAASVAVDGDDNVEHWEVEVLDRQDGRKRKKKRENTEWSARAAHLPSKVQAGYEQVVEQDLPQSSKTPDSTTKLRKSPSIKSRDSYSYFRKDRAKNITSPLSYDYVPMGVRNDVQIKGAVSGSERSTENPALRQDRRREKNLTADATSAELRALDKAEVSKDYADADEDDEHLQESAATLSHDVELFFRELSCPSRSPNLRIEHSSRLLRRALDLGTLAEVRSLYLWRLKVTAISDDNIRDICEACLNFSVRTPRKSLLDFYKKLLVSRRFLQMPSETQLYCTLVIYAESFWGDLFDTLGMDLSLGLRNRNAEEIKFAFNRACDKFLEDKRPGDAMALLWPVQKYLQRITSPIEDLDSAADKIFSFALCNNQLWYCTRIMIRWLRRVPGKELKNEVFRWAKALLTKAHQTKQYGPVATLLETTKTQSFLARICDQMGDVEKVCLAIACTKAKSDCQTLWDRLYKDIPESHREDVVRARTVDKLRGTWRATHNLDLINQLVDEVLDWIDTNCPENLDLKLTVRLTMVEILNSARKPELALKLLERINESHAHSSLSLSMTAVTLATKGSWKEVHQLLDILGRWTNFNMNKDVSRKFNKLLMLYSAQHTADETWSFFTSLIVQLKFKPNPVTKLIMLKCFITTQALHLIPRWLRLLRVVKRPIFVDSDIAARILEHYYHKYHPPHILMFWFARVLVETAPSLKPEAFVGLIKDSIAYDFRKRGDEQHKLKAHQNLEALEQAQGQIPAPVNSLKEALRLKEHRDAYQNHLESIVEGMLTDTPFVDEISHDGGATSPTIDRSADNTQSLFTSSAGEDAQQASAGDVEEHWARVLNDWNTVDPRSHDSALPAAAYHPLVKSEGGHVPHLEDVIDEPIRLNNPSTLYTSADDDTRGPLHALPRTTTDLASARLPAVTSAEHAPNPIAQFGDISSVHESSSEEELERDMILNLSLHRYKEVLNLYRRRIAAEGIPSSSTALQVAVQASLRLRKGDPAEAEEIIGTARAAGIDITAATDQLLMQRVWASSLFEKRDVKSLTMMVTEHYQAMEESGLRVNHHLGLTAANVLINNRRPKHGLNLLDSIHKSPRALDRPFKIAAMTIYLKGFAAIQSRAGIRWVVTSVLDENMPIDRRFLDTLRSSSRDFDSDKVRRMGGLSDMEATQFIEHIRHWHTVCIERRRQQRQQSKQTGWKLVSVLGMIANSLDATLVQSSRRKHVEQALLGRAASAIPSDATREEMEAQRSTAFTLQANDDACDYTIAEMKRVLYIEKDSPSRSLESRPIDHEDWLNQYRLILQQRIVIDDEPARFRYQLDIDVKEPMPKIEECVFDDIVEQAQEENA